MQFIPHSIGLRKMLSVLRLLLAGFFLSTFSFSLIADDGEPLRDAARRGNLDTVKELLAKKVEVDAPSEYGVTALALACDHGHEEVVKLLLDAGAKPSAKDKFYRISPLGWAISRKKTAIVELLLQRDNTEAESLLPSAVGGRQPEIVAALLTHGKPSEKALLEALTTAKAIAKATPDSEPAKKIVEALQITLPEATIAEYEKKLAAPKPDTEKFKPYEGMYQSEAGLKLNLRILNGQLVATDPETDRNVPLQAEQNETFTSRGLTVSFTKEKDAVATMIWKTGDRESIFKRLPAGASDAKPADAPPEAPTVDLGPDFPLESENWPSFRGTLGRGINNAKPLATEWDGAAAKNIAWKLLIDGLATSSPIVWGKDIFLTTAVQSADSKGFRTGAYGDVESVEIEGECSYQLWCVNLDTGELRWKQEAAKEIPKVKRHLKSSHANPTPATDGKHVIAFFGGAGLYCYDTEGKQLWKQDLGMLDSGWFYDKSYQWGFGSSPFIFEGAVIVQCDAQDECFLAAIDLVTGEIRWKTQRKDIPTWSSPVAFYAPDGTPTVIATGTKCTAGYDARSGAEFWKMGGFSEIVVPTPQITPTAALLTSGYAPVQPILGLKHSARGDLKIPESGKPEGPFLWSQMRGGPYMPTPIVFENRVYVLDNSGILSCLDLGTGAKIFRQRLRSDKASAYTSSPVAAGGNLYCTSEEGHTFVVTLDKEGKTVAQNDLGESVLASPAIAQGKLLLRGEKHLFAIAEKSP